MSIKYCSKCTETKINTEKDYYKTLNKDVFIYQFLFAPFDILCNQKFTYDEFKNIIGFNDDYIYQIKNENKYYFCEECLKKLRKYTHYPKGKMFILLPTTYNPEDTISAKQIKDNETVFRKERQFNLKSTDDMKLAITDDSDEDEDVSQEEQLNKQKNEAQIKKRKGLPTFKEEKMKKEDRAKKEQEEEERKQQEIAERRRKNSEVMMRFMKRKEPLSEEERLKKEQQEEAQKIQDERGRCEAANRSR